MISKKLITSAVAGFDLVDFMQSTGKSIVFPKNAETGDILVYAEANFYPGGFINPDISTPAGFTEIASSTSGAFSTSLYFFGYRIIDGSEAGSYQTTYGGSGTLVSTVRQSLLFRATPAISVLAGNVDYSRTAGTVPDSTLESTSSPIPTFLYLVNYATSGFNLNPEVNCNTDAPGAKFVGSGAMVTAFLSVAGAGQRSPFVATMDNLGSNLRTVVTLKTS